MEIYGVEEDEIEEDEEDEFDPDATNQSCSWPCGDRLPYETEVFLLTVAVCSIQLGSVAYPPALDSEGDFLYEPCFFCFSCWEDIEDEIRTRTRDTPPIADDYAVLECSICCSGIRRDEVLGVIQIGELIRSHRTPDDQVAASFKPNSSEPTDHVLCIVCLNILNTDIIDTLWTCPVMQHNECSEGSALRCWRHGCSAENNCPHVKEID